MKKYGRPILALLLVLCLSVPASAAETAASFSGGIAEIQKYGNLVLDIPAASLTEAGYAYGDILTVTVDGKAYDVPLCTNYSDVDTGELVLRDSGGTLTLAINMGDFASANGIAEKGKAEDGSTVWTVSGGRALTDLSVSIAMKEPGGYRDQYLIHQLVRTNDRADYATDQVFANFRNLAFGDLGENALFRSSSPVNNALGRAAYADAFAKASQIKTVVNLADSPDEIPAYFTQEDFQSPYYRSLYEAGSVKALGLGVDFTAEDFRSGLAEGLRFMAAQEGPYLVHCLEGKDRAGFVSALLSCFMGASYDQVVSDYMTTYENYYHLQPGSEQYEAVKNSNIVSILKTVTGAEQDALPQTDLTAAAEEYLNRIGLTEAERSALRANLSRDYLLQTEAPAQEETPSQEDTPAQEDTPSQEETPAQEDTPAQPQEAGTVYTVAAGDCLWSIARRVYGSGTLWPKLYEANRDTIRSADLIYVGQTLTIPAL